MSGEPGRPAPDEQGVIQGVALLDLSPMRSAEELARIKSIRVAVLTTRQPALDAGWWSGLMGQVSAAVIQAAVLPDSARVALRPVWTPA